MSDHATHSPQPHRKGFHGPKCWIITILVGALAGFLLGQAPFAQLPKVEAEAAHLDPDDPDAVVRIVERNRAGEEIIHFDARQSDAGPSSTIVSAEPDGLLPQMPPKAPAGSESGEHENRGGPAEAGSGDHATDEHGEGHAEGAAHGPDAVIPLWLLIPFAVMLLSIAVMPFINEHFWHQHFPDFAFFLGALMVAFYLVGPLDWEYSHGMSYGMYKMYHVGLEYYAFIALIGGLFVASGGILIDVRTTGRPAVNTALLAFGAVIANIVGTTGASVLLIRPFMRINKGRLKPIHIVLFIFIVSNCGGCLTPIGDPPLYLGFLRGVPFQWTLLNLWPMWLLCVGSLLALFFVIDSRIKPADEIETVQEVMLLEDDARGGKGPPVMVRGLPAIVALFLIVGGVFIDPLVFKWTGKTVHGIGPTFQIAVAAIAYFMASEKIHKANQFTFFPVKEVGFLFVGIFTTMAPALAYLETNGSELGIESPTLFYFATGGLSACLDNAPTYLNFLQAAFGVLHTPLTAENIQQHFIHSEYFITHAGGDVKHFHGGTLLSAISLGAVFFGAMTYIGNGPNFMVKSIAEASGMRMPSFFGYLLLSTVLLLPVLVLVWVVFISGWVL